MDILDISNAYPTRSPWRPNDLQALMCLKWPFIFFNFFPSFLPWRLKWPLWWEWLESEEELLLLLLLEEPEELLLKELLLPLILTKLSLNITDRLTKLSLCVTDRLFRNVVHSDYIEEARGGSELRRARPNALKICQSLRLMLYCTINCKQYLQSDITLFTILMWFMIVTYDPDIVRPSLLYLLRILWVGTQLEAKGYWPRLLTLSTWLLLYSFTFF